MIDIEGLKQFIEKQIRREVKKHLDTTPIPVVGFKRLRPEENDLPLPAYQTPGSVAMDVQACLPEREVTCQCKIWSPEYRAAQAKEFDTPNGCSWCNPETNTYKVRNLTLNGHERMAITTGFALKLPPGYETQIRSRSGLALKEGIIVLNAPGTIDWDYTGELKIILFNTTDKPFVITHGMRIAQMAVTPIVQAGVEEIKDLPTTERGDGGLGSTGL